MNFRSSFSKRKMANLVKNGKKSFIKRDCQKKIILTPRPRLFSDLNLNNQNSFKIREFYECFDKTWTCINILFKLFSKWKFYLAGQQSDGSPFTWAHRDPQLFKPGNYSNLEVLFDLCQVVFASFGNAFVNLWSGGMVRKQRRKTMKKKRR